jgi:hypothetical protein
MMMTNKLTKVLCLLFGLAAFSSGFESYFKFRMHKDLVQTVLQANLKLLFNRANKMQNKDQYLDDLKASLTNIAVDIKPTNKEWK